MLCREIFEFAIKNDLCEKDYSQYLEISSEKEKAKKTSYSSEEVKLVWDNKDWIYEIEGATTRNHMHGAKLVDSVLILLYTGMRIQEMLDLECSDVNMKEGYITVKGTKTANSQRYVPIADKIKPLIENRLKQGKTNLITNAAGKKIAYPQYRLFYLAMCEALGINHSIHECRHTFATFAMYCKMDDSITKFIIGHSQGDLTKDVYTDELQLIPRMIEEMKKYDPLIKLKKK